MVKQVKVKSLSHVWLFATPWTVAYQAPPSMGSRQEYWSGLPFPSPGDLTNSGIKPGSPAFQADALTSEPPGKPTVKQEVLPYFRVIFFQSEKLFSLYLFEVQKFRLEYTKTLTFG